MKKQALNKKTSRQLIAVKSNDLIDNARSSFTLTEYKIIFFLIHAIKREDRERGLFQDNYTLYTKDLINLSGTKSKAEWQRVAQLLSGLLTKKFTLLEGDRIIEMTYLSYVDIPRHFGKNAYITFSFTSHLRPYLLQLKKNFTAFDIQQVFKLKSTYGIHFYKYLKRFQYQGHFVLTLAQIRSQLFLDSRNTEYKYFRRDMLEVARRDTFQYTDLSFEYEPAKKEGRKIVALRFTIIKGANPPPNEQIDFYQTAPAQVRQNTSKEAQGESSEQPQQLLLSIAEKLVYFGLTRKEVTHWLQTKDERCLTSILAKWEPIIERGVLDNGDKITNPQGMLRWAIENDAGYSKHELEKKEADELMELQERIDEAYASSSSVQAKFFENYKELNAAEAAEYAISFFDDSLSSAEQSKLLKAVEQHRDIPQSMAALIQYAHLKLWILRNIKTKAKQDLEEYRKLAYPELWRKAMRNILPKKEERAFFEDLPAKTKSNFYAVGEAERSKCDNLAEFTDALRKKYHVLLEVEFKKVKVLQE